MFYDPMFAVATAILSLLTYPVWAAMAGDLIIGAWFTLAFASADLAFMLCVSYQMAHEK